MVVEVTRRAALGSIAAAVGGGRVGSLAAPSVTAATRNLYLGADLFRLFFESEESPAATVGSLLEQVDASAVGRRMDAVAAELAATRPDVVGLQEVAHIRTERPSDETPDGAPDADTTRYDFLALLRSALADRGVAYDVAAVSTNTDAEFPALVDDERVDVRLTDRDALLVRRETTEATAATAATFDAAFTAPVGDGFTLARGYATADLRVRGRALTAATTHLEPASAAVRTAQAEELRSALAAPSTAVVLGDLNDGPASGGGAYEVLTGAFTDAHAAARPDAWGGEPTCCFPPSLREGDPETALADRYDVVLARGLRPTSARRVGVDASARVAFDGDLLWPSDHAGVVATFGGETATDRPGTATGTTAQTPPPTVTGQGGTASPSATPTADASSTVATADPSPTSAAATAGEGTTATTAPGFGAAVTALGTLAAGVRLAVGSDET